MSFGDAIILWLARIAVEVGLGLAITLVLLLLVFGPGMLRQWRCKHPRWFENGRCHAICRECHKDLGFMGTWLEKHR